MFNYLLLLSLFLFMIAVCFLPGFIELRWPKDSGPVYIDLDRDVDERYFAKAFKRYLNSGVSSSRARSIPLARDLGAWLKGLPAKLLNASINRGPEEILIIEGDLNVPPSTTLRPVLLVKGDLKTGDDCRLELEAEAVGDCNIGKSNNILCLTARNVLLGEGSVVEGWIDADEELVISENCKVMSRATAGRKVTLAPGCALKSVAAPLVSIFSEGADISTVEEAEEAVEEAAGEIGAGTKSELEREPVDIVAVAPEDVEPGDADGEATEVEGASPEDMVVPVEAAGPHAEPTTVKWTSELDHVLSRRFQRATLQEVGAELEVLAGTHVSLRAVLARANQIGLIGKPLTTLKEEQKPAYLRSLTVMLQAPDTIRVKGSLSVPEGEKVPYELIVDGDLTSDKGVVFCGSVKAKGSVNLGEISKVDGSLIAGGDVHLGDYASIAGCVDAGGSIFAHNEVQIGISGTGGMASRSSIYMGSGVGVRGKIYADQAVNIVRSIEEPQDKQI